MRHDRRVTDAQVEANFVNTKHNQAARMTSLLLHRQQVALTVPTSVTIKAQLDLWTVAMRPVHPSSQALNILPFSIVPLLPWMVLLTLASTPFLCLP